MGLTQVQWDELDAMTRFTIQLHLVESKYFTILECKTAHEVWQKLCSTHEKNMAGNKVFLMHKLYNLRMKEFTIVASNLNEFESLFAQNCAQKLQIDEEMKAIHLLCSLPPL